MELGRQTVHHKELAAQRKTRITFWKAILDYTQIDDPALLRLIADGQTKALDELYSRYGRLVYTVAFRVIGEQASAEEITLDVFSKVWQKADTYRSERGNVRVWIASMARNRAIDVLRRKNVQLNVQQKFWAEKMVSLPNSIERSPESTVDLLMRKERITVAINQLTEEQRQVLALAYFRGYTQSEIAKLLDLPLGTVKTRIRSGMQMLRRLLKEEQIK